MKLFRLTGLVAVGATLAACATSPTGRSQFMLISPEAAIVESRKAYVSMVGAYSKENKLVTDPIITDRIQVITGRLVHQAVAAYPRTAKWEWSVAIVDDPETINAWAMAGGRMAIYTGIINKLQLTDAEIAAIMGHEIAHALANHTAERMSVAMASQMGVVAVAVASNSDAAVTGAALAAQLALQLPNSRTSESEADRIGIELAARAGYDPQAAVTLWEKMGKAGGNGPPEFLSTHPAPGNRQATLSRLVPQMRELQPASLGTVAQVAIVK